MYIDPGTGGMLAGVLLSILGVLSASVLVFAGKIKMFFARFRRNAGDPVESVIEDPSEE